jgi:hypothetical protein
MYVGLTGSNVALASTTSSGVQRVEYYANNVYIGVGYSSPSFQVNWVPSASGQFSLTAKAYDALNTSGVSATRTVIVAQPGMPAIAATNGTADQYFPMGTTWKRQKRRALDQPNATSFLHSFFQPMGSNTWRFHWPPDFASSQLDLNNTSYEVWNIRSGCSGGSSWIYVNSFNDIINGNTYNYPLSVATALLDYGGSIYDVTSTCAGGGQPYVPLNIPASEVKIRVWGTILGSPSRPYYWEARFNHTGSATNSCWQGTGSSSRSTWTMKEAWWDATYEWSIGSQTPVAYDPSGFPNGLNVQMGREDRLGQGAGFSWYAHDYKPSFYYPNGWESCTTNFEDYTP